LAADGGHKEILELLKKAKAEHEAK
jgi:hypothetical protein